MNDERFGQIPSFGDVAVDEVQGILCGKSVWVVMETPNFTTTSDIAEILSKSLHSVSCDAFPKIFTFVRPLVVILDSQMCRWTKSWKWPCRHRYLRIYVFTDHHYYKNTLRRHVSEIAMEICSGMECVKCHDLSWQWFQWVYEPVPWIPFHRLQEHTQNSFRLSITWPKKRDWTKSSLGKHRNRCRKKFRLTIESSPAVTHNDQTHSKSKHFTQTYTIHFSYPWTEDIHAWFSGPLSPFTTHQNKIVNKIQKLKLFPFSTWARLGRLGERRVSFLHIYTEY